MRTFHRNKSNIRQGPSIMLNINDFISGILTVISLFSFATSSLICHDKIGTKVLQTTMMWGSLVSSSFLVFSVQLGVQTMPNLLSGVLFPANDRSILKGITRSIQCILLVIVLKVWTLIKKNDQLHFQSKLHLQSNHSILLQLCAKKTNVFT